MAKAGERARRGIDAEVLSDCKVVGHVLAPRRGPLSDQPVVLYQDFDKKMSGASLALSALAKMSRLLSQPCTTTYP